MKRRAGLSAISLIPLVISADYATAQETVALPEITVTAPSPIVRRPARTTVTVTPATPAPQPAADPILYRGSLPIIADQFATVTAVSRDDIDRSTGQTLGEVLQSKPGITSSGFAPGGASRPIVRGQDNYRVRIQENGLSASGVSELGEDHGVPIDPLATQQVEVIRGPATLRYGSQAIGGVINAENNRIPTMIPKRGVSGEFRSSVNSVDKGREGAVLLDAGGGNFAIHADAFGRSAGDYKIPSYPYLAPEDPAPQVGRWQPNSANNAKGTALGGSYIFDQGFIGLAISEYKSLYRIPGQEATETRTRIDLRQQKIASKGEFRPDSGPVEAMRFWLGTTNYKHDEIADEGGFEGVQQTFTNKEREGRAEIQLRPFDLRFAALTTALGVQYGGQDLTAFAPGGVGGLFDPNTTRSVAGYMFNELRFNATQRMQLAGRFEHNSVKGAVPDLFVDETLNIARHREFDPKSGSVGFLQDLPYDMVASVTAQYVERAPRAPELLSRGVHEATGTFDIGNPNLRIEKARSLELGLRRATGPWRFEVTGYYTKFDGFIYRNLTGQTCDDDFASCTPAGAGTELQQAVYAQRDATFRGAEFQTQLDVAPLWHGQWGVDGQYDIVRATFSDGSNVPRIPPQRLGGGVYYRDANWFARVGMLHAFAQNNVSDFETSTAGYNLLKAELSYETRLPGDPSGFTRLKVGIVGDNLLNDDVRYAQSFKKDEVLQPGRAVKLFANVKF